MCIRDRSQGTTIAEIMALLGVEPVRDRRGKVIDVRVIPIKELGRPRVDAVSYTHLDVYKRQRNYSQYGRVCRSRALTSRELPLLYEE